MVITNFQVQHILKAYSQQLSSKSRATKEKMGKSAPPKDEVSISQESKKRWMADRIAHEMVLRWANEPDRNETIRQVMKRLSEEYGRSLDVEKRDGEGIVFKVLGQLDGQGNQYLPPPENEQLQRKLFDITRSVVYNDLVKGERL